MNSSVIKWPSRAVVDRAVRNWSAEQARRRSDVVRIGYFGSYARGDWGVGSDLDLIAVVTEASQPFERRGLEWDLSALPVSAEIIVYSSAEWKELNERDDRFARMLKREAVWTVTSE